MAGVRAAWQGYGRSRNACAGFAPFGCARSMAGVCAQRDVAVLTA